MSENQLSSEAIRKNLLSLIQRDDPKPIVITKKFSSMDDIIAKCRQYPTFNALLSYHQSQGYKVIDSFCLGTSLACLSYLYSHSYEIGIANISRKTPLNLFIALGANTGYEKTGYLSDCRNETIQCINKAIHEKFGIHSSSFTTYLPSSAEGLQKLCGEMPVRFFGLDEAKQFTKAKAPSPKYDVFEAIRNMFDKYIFGLSVTKKAENNNKATDQTFATMLISDTTAGIKNNLLSLENLENGTANRYLIIFPSSTRCGSKKPIRVEKEFFEEVCFCHLRKMVEIHIHYDVTENLIPGSLIEKTQIIKRIAKEIHSPEIDSYYQAISEKNDKILDDYDANGIEIEPKIIMLTRQMVIKMRIAYLLWIDSEFKNDLQCAKDADELVEVLNTTCFSIYENNKATPEILKTKVLSLREKYPPGAKIYLSKLTQHKAPLDLKVYGNVLSELEQYLRTLANLNQITLFQNDKRIIGFAFCVEE